MISFVHQRFLSENNVDVSTLPEMLQQRISGFNELEQDLEETVGEDRDELLGKLFRLSYEIEEDLEEYFEDRLSGNAYAEEEPEIIPVEEPQLKLTPTPDPTPIEEPIVKAPSDEEILQRLYEQKQTKVHPDYLKSQGFSVDINSRDMLFGRFCLRRGKYSTCYNITLTKA